MICALHPRRVLLGAALLLSSCSDDDAQLDTDTQSTESAGTGTESTGAMVPDVPPVEPAFRVEFELAGLALSLWRDDVRLLAFEAEGLQWGVVDEIEDSKSYDPMFNLDVTWHSPVSAEMLAMPNAMVAVRLAYEGGGHATLVVREPAEGRFIATWTPDDDAPVVAVHRFVARTDPNEGFYGLGEVFDTPNHRGQSRAMQIEAVSGQ